ncbi:MAG: insulinase family protein [Saprospiraceae bacterium]|nr:insulinase family protein [Saprospiraceae bacterium]
MKIKTISLATILLLGIVLPSSAQKEKLPEGVVKNTAVEGITEYELENGLKVLLFPDQSKPTITVNVTYLVGSRHEGYGETGMAHLLEHLVFKGTPNHPNIPQELTEHGARPNGTTWYDRTNYFETFSATRENLEWALDLESDRMINSFIAKEDLDSEMTVVRNEYERGENSPQGVLMKRVMSAAFQWHNYGKTTIGARSDLENVPIDRLQAFYRKYYQPDNAVLTVAGKIDEKETLKMVNDYFGKIPRPERNLIPTYTKEPTQDGEKLVTLKRVGDVQSVAVTYHTPPGPHSDYPAVAVIEELMTNEPGGRLYKALVETNKASSQWGFAPGLAEGGFIYFNADVRKDNDIEAARETMLATLDDLKANPPTQEEVDRAKARILKNWELAYNSSDRVGLTMSEAIAAGDWRLFFLFRDRIDKVSVEDVVRVSNKYFVPSNRTVGMFLPVDEPVRAEIPDPPNVKKLVAGYKGKEEIAVGEEFDPSPANIDKRTQTGSFESGVEYAFLSKENRGDAVVANLIFRYGTPKSLYGKSQAARFAGTMLNKGTANYDRQAIQDKLSELKANVRVSGGRSSASARIETTNENLAAVIDLVAEMFKSPTFPEEEFEKSREESLARLEEQLSDPQALAGEKFNKLLNPYPKSDIRYPSSLKEDIEDIESLKIEDVKDFYNTFYGASDATFSVVGDFDEELIRNKLDAHFGDWKSGSKYIRITDPYIEINPEEAEINTPDKSNSMFFAGMPVKVNDSHEDYAAMMIGNYMLGGGFLNSRLATRIRQQDGLSYGVGSFFNGSSMDDGGMLGAYAISAPENTAKVQAAFKEEIHKVISEGFTEEELEAAKSGWLQAQTVSRSQDRSLMGSLNNNLRLDRTMAWSQKLEDKIAQLTAEDVNKAMKRHIHPDKMVYVRAGDFEKLKKEIKP